MSDEIDWLRLPFEQVRALEENGHALETVAGPLAGRWDDDEWVVIDSAGVELGRIPRYRLRQWDPGRMRDHAALQAARLPAFQTDQAIAAINAKDYTVIPPPESDWVFLDVCGEPFMKVQRRDVVDGWPPDV